MQEVITEWGVRLFFDGMHQLGLVAGIYFQNPLREGESVITRSASKTFSGLQSGIIVWDNPSLTEPLKHTISRCLPLLTRSTAWPLWPPPPPSSWPLGKRTWPRSCATPRRSARPSTGAASPCWARTRAIRPPRSSPMCASSVADYMWRSNWQKPISSPTRT
jgi:hypothetical protein